MLHKETTLAERQVLESAEPGVAALPLNKVMATPATPAAKV